MLLRRALVVALSVVASRVGAVRVRALVAADDGKAGAYLV